MQRMSMQISQPGSQRYFGAGQGMFLNNKQLIIPTAELPAKSLKVNTALTAPMVLRVHNVKPGCGSCGK